MNLFITSSIFFSNKYLLKVCYMSLGKQGRVALFPKGSLSGEKQTRIVDSHKSGRVCKPWLGGTVEEEEGRVCESP